MVKGLNNLSYEEKFVKLKLPSLECRGQRGCVIEVFKILNGGYGEQVTRPIFTSNMTDLRGNN